MSKIFYFMGKSASGKDTIFKQIKERMPNLKNNCNLYNTSDSGRWAGGCGILFCRWKKIGWARSTRKVIELRAYNTVHGVWKYFTVDDGQFDGDENYIAIGTLESYAKMLAYMGTDSLVPIYIDVDDGVRLLRAVERERKQKEPKYEELCKEIPCRCRGFLWGKLTKNGDNSPLF